MADFLATFTNAGRALYNRNQSQGRATPITALEIGTGNRTPDGTEVALVSPFNPRKRFTDPAGSAAGENYSIDFLDDTVDRDRAGLEYSYSELGAWSDATLVWYFSRAMGLIGSKPFNTRHQFPLVGTFAGAVLNNFTFTTTTSLAPASKNSAGVVRFGSATSDRNSDTVVLSPREIRALIATEVTAADGTDLSVSGRTSTRLILVSSTGSNVELPLATNLLAGLLSSTGFVDLTEVAESIAEAGTTTRGRMSPRRVKAAVEALRPEWDGTQAQYDALTSKDSKTTYYIHES